MHLLQAKQMSDDGPILYGSINLQMSNVDSAMCLLPREADVAEIQKSPAHSGRVTFEVRPAKLGPHRAPEKVGRGQGETEWGRGREGLWMSQPRMALGSSTQDPHPQAIWP